MIQKSIPKFIQFLKQKLSKVLAVGGPAKFSKRSIGTIQKTVLAILIASLFLPFLSFGHVKSDNQSVVSSITSIPTAQAAGCDLNKYFTGTVLINKSEVSPDESFDIYFKMNMDKDTADACKAKGENAVALSPWAYRPACLKGDYLARTQSNYRGSYFSENGSYGYHALIKGVTANKLGYDQTTFSAAYLCVYGYYHGGTESADSAYYITQGGLSNLGQYKKVTIDNSTTSHNPTENLPSIPPAEVITSSNSNDVKAIETIKVTTKGTTGLRDKYRVLFQEKSPYDKMAFGQNGLPKISLDWGGPESVLLTNITKLKIPSKNYQIGSNPFYRYTWVGLNYFDTKIDSDGCKSGYFTESCDQVIFSDSNKNGKHSSEQASLPADFDPVLFNAAWAKSEFSSKTAESGKPLGTVDFRVIPIIWAGSGLVKTDWYSYVMGTTPIKFTVEVYKSEEDIKKACEDDASITDKTICSDPEKMRYEVGKVVEVTTGSDQKSGDLTSDLFNFLRKVISYIVLLITSTIYWVFSIILVPILNALLKIRPYQDEFVNFIYPGWVIMRNLANIGFIIALLWMGLRVLFQVDDSGKTRGFILWLVLMALLVNFSLVIGQGIVGIADTVQAQFLPAESKVIEALGQKLMVDPIKFFRGQSSDAKISDGSNFSVDASASDISKPIVLLILAVAAFFSFVALIAFILVRLVALWILYMLAPVAYVARILPDTKKYWDQWWTEFIKYAFTVPILAFFLNITALMATTFASRNGDAVIAGRDRNYILGGVAGEFTEYAITIISHFVVLVFLFIGMKFALSSGHAGAKQIVDGAKKGFNFVTKTAPMAAKNWASGKASDALDNLGFTGLSKGLAAITNPKMFGEALKKKWIDDPTALREANQRRRIGDIKYLTRSDSTAKALDNAKLAQKDFDSEASGYLQAKMREGDTMNNRYMTQGAMLSLAKNKNFDELVKSAEDITGQKFGRNAAGLNAAVRSLAKKQGWTGAEEKQMMKTLDHMSGVDNKTAHYAGNAEYDEKKKEWKIKDLNPQADPNNSNGQQQLATEPHKEYIKNLVKRRGGKSMVEDAKTFSADSMVEKDPSGNITGWTDAQVGVMAGRDVSVLSNRDLAKKFKETDNYQKIKKGYEEMGRGVVGGSRQALIDKMQNYQNRYVDPQNRMSIQEITAKANLIDSNFMSGPANPQGGNQTGGGNNPNNPPNNPQGGNQTGGGNNPNNPPNNPQGGNQPGGGTVINIPTPPTPYTPSSGGGLVNQYGQPLSNPIFRNQLNNPSVRNQRNSNKSTVVVGNTNSGQSPQNISPQTTTRSAQKPNVVKSGQANASSTPQSVGKQSTQPIVTKTQKTAKQSTPPATTKQRTGKNNSPKVEILKPLTSSRPTSGTNQVPTEGQVIKGRQADNLVIPENPVVENQSSYTQPAVDTTLANDIDSSPLAAVPNMDVPADKPKPSVKSMSKRELIDQRMKHYRELKDMESQNNPKYQNDMDRLRTEMRDFDDEIQNKEDSDV